MNEREEEQQRLFRIISFLFFRDVRFHCISNKKGGVDKNGGRAFSPVVRGIGVKWNSSFSC